LVLEICVADSSARDLGFLLLSPCWRWRGILIVTVTSRTRLRVVACRPGYF
jgi:hypothetical protein